MSNKKCDRIGEIKIQYDRSAYFLRPLLCLPVNPLSRVERTNRYNRTGLTCKPPCLTKRYYRIGVTCKPPCPAPTERGQPLLTLLYDVRGKTTIVSAKCQVDEIPKSYEISRRYKRPDVTSRTQLSSCSLKTDKDIDQLTTVSSCTSYPISQAEPFHFP